MTTETINATIDSRPSPDGPIPTLTIGDQTGDASTWIAEFHKAGRSDIADAVEAFVADELAQAIHPTAKAQSVQAPSPEAIAEPAKATPNERPVVIRLELADGIRIASMPDRVTERVLQRDAEGRLAGSVDRERDA